MIDLEYARSNTQLLDMMPADDPDRAVVDAARVSFYKTAGVSAEKDRKLIFYLMQHQHWTPFEMIELKWRITCPLFVARQWMRHRTGSFNEVSRRYTSEQLTFFKPSLWRVPAADNKQQSTFDTEGKLNQLELLVKYEQHLAASWKLYQEFLDAGVAREQARMLLPQSTETSFYWKVNARNFLHFIELRLAPDAQQEIQDFARVMWEQFQARVPITAAAFNQFYLQKES